MIFLKQPTSTLKNHLRMGLQLLEIKFIPCVLDCPRTTHFSNSCWHSLICICWNRRKKSVAILRHFCVLPLNIAHTFRANEHSRNMTYCFGRLTAKLTFRMHPYSSPMKVIFWVGRQFEHALHINIRTFGGTLPEFAQSHI